MSGSGAEQTKLAFDELMAVVSSLDQRFDEVGDDQGVLEGYKWIPTLLQGAMQVYVWADSRRPQWGDIVGPTLKSVGVNADAFYQFAPLDAGRSHRGTFRPV